MSKCKDHLQIIRGLSISIYPSLTRAMLISVSSLLLWGFYLALVSANPGATFDLLGYLSPSDVMNMVLRIFMFWKSPILQDLLKMYPIHLVLPGVSQTQGIQTSPQFHLMRKAHWRLERFSTRTHIFNLCFCTKLTSVLPRF